MIFQLDYVDAPILKNGVERYAGFLTEVYSITHSYS